MAYEVPLVEKYNKRQRAFTVNPRNAGKVLDDIAQALRQYQSMKNRHSS